MSFFNQLLFPIISVSSLWQFNHMTKNWDRKKVRRLLIGLFVLTIFLGIYLTFGLPYIFKDAPDNDAFPNVSSMSKANLFFMPCVFILLVGLEISRNWLMRNKGYSKPKATIVALIPYLLMYFLLRFILGTIF